MTRNEQGLSARRATSEPTDETPNDDASTLSASLPTKSGTRRNGASGSATTESGSDSTSLISKPSARRSSASTKRWRKPRNVREFAAQANEVATMMLNGDLDIDTARAYSSIARGIAQMMSINVTRARFLKTEPVLDFDDDE